MLKLAPFWGQPSSRRWLRAGRSHRPLIMESALLFTGVERSVVLTATGADGWNDAIVPKLRELVGA